jgi:hypothetical protein
MIRWMMIINATGMKWWKQLFYINEHRINNTGWMMKWQWNGGVERKANPLLRECWTFLIYIFLHQQWKQCLEFTLGKLREICKYLAGACNSNSHARGLHYFTFVCKTKQGKSMQRGESSHENVSKELSVINSLWNAKKPLCKLKSLHCHQKTTTSLCKVGTKRELEKKVLRPQADNAQYNTQGWGGGEMWEEHILIYEPGEIVWQCT